MLPATPSWFPGVAEPTDTEKRLASRRNNNKYWLFTVVKAVETGMLLLLHFISMIFLPITGQYNTIKQFKPLTSPGSLRPLVHTSPPRSRAFCWAPLRPPPHCRRRRRQLLQPVSPSALSGSGSQGGWGGGGAALPLVWGWRRKAKWSSWVWSSVCVRSNRPAPLCVKLSCKCVCVYVSDCVYVCVVSFWLLLISSSPWSPAHSQSTTDGGGWYSYNLFIQCRPVLPLNIRFSIISIKKKEKKEEKEKGDESDAAAAASGCRCGCTCGDS